MPQIVIQGTPIDFPDTSASPIWSDAVIQFALAVELALSGLTSAGDLAKQYFPLTGAHNPISNLAVTGFQFDPTSVRSVYARYYVYRNTTATTVTEAGTLTMIYNAANSPGSKWEVVQERAGDAQCSFAITDAGQVQITTTTIAGTNHTGKVGFTASVLAQ